MVLWAVGDQCYHAESALAVYEWDEGDGRESLCIRQKAIEKLLNTTH